MRHEGLKGWRLSSGDTPRSNGVRFGSKIEADWGGDKKTSSMVVVTFAGTVGLKLWCRHRGYPTFLGHLAVINHHW